MVAGRAAHSFFLEKKDHLPAPFLETEPEHHTGVSQIKAKQSYKTA
jgi:hypothetical protein